MVGLTNPTFSFLASLLYHKIPNKTNRENIKGGFFETFRDPLFIVEQTREGQKEPSIYFYKPFFDKDKRLMNLFGIGIDSNGSINFKTYYFDDSGSRLRRILNNQVKILYTSQL